jgi:hypothetical protein
MNDAIMHYVFNMEVDTHVHSLAVIAEEDRELPMLIN